MGCKQVWALCRISLNYVFNFPGLVFAAGRFLYATVSRPMIHPLQDRTESNLARQAQVSVGRMKALFIIVFQI